MNDKNMKPWMNTDRPEIATIWIAGIPYRSAKSKDGQWDTGLCETDVIAAQRLALWEAGLEVSEAAPGLLSRRQLDALAKWQHRMSGGSTSFVPLTDQDTLAAALDGGPGCPAWVWISVLAIRRWDEVPYEVQFAGGARVRRGSQGQVVHVGAAGEHSLARG